MKFHWLAFGLMLRLGAHAAEWSVVASFNAAKAEDGAKAGDAADYRYSTEEIPATSPAAESAERKIAFGNETHLAWAGVLPEAQNKIKAAFLSDSAERVQQIKANDCLLEAHLALPKWRKLEREWAVAKETANGGVEVSVRGSCDEATGGYVIRLAADGRIRMNYDFTSRVEENPRQWDVVFFAAKDFDALKWNRQAQWSVYPPDHIGRPTGTAIARVFSGAKPYAIQKPDHAWSQDATELGGNDFASTKTGILGASLVSARGKIAVASDGRQSVRAFVDGERTGLLVTGFHTGGGDGFFNTHFSAERKPLTFGTRLSDPIHLQLSHN